MIKCGRLKGKDDEVAEQCILYTKDGSKALGYFPYSKYGGQKGAKAAAHKREGQIQFFKQKHQGLLEAIEAFGAPVVLKYLLDTGCSDCEQVVKAHVAEWLEKAEKGKGWTPPPKGWTPASLQKYWKAMGGSVTSCMKKAEGHVSDPAKFCASLKDKVTGTTKWRGPHKKKSFDETIEEALTLLQKDEDEEMGLEDIDLRELEAWLSGEEAADLSEQADVEPEPTETEPEPASDVEPEPAPEPEPEPVEEQPLDFRTFLLREHAQRRADILAALGEEVIEDG